jgi:hypothetical protein
MQQYSSLHRQVMRRVYAVYLYRIATSVTALRLYATVFFAAVLTTSVSISHVVANMPAVTDVGAWYQFNVAAFSHTELSVKFLLVSIALLALWLLRDFVRGAVKNTHSVISERAY